MPRWWRLGRVRRVQQVDSRRADKFCYSDTYDIYFRNPDLIPPRINHPADYPPAEVWTLDKSRGDATVEDICNFIVEYINSDVMVRLVNIHEPTEL